MEKYYQTDELQKLINWKEIMPMKRYAGGHDDQMCDLFENTEVIAHYNENDYQGQVATCIKFREGKFKNKYAIYNDYYGSCSGCDLWEDATDSEVIKLCIDLSNSAYIFENILDVKEFLSSESNEWNSWGNNLKKELLNLIENRI